MSCKKIMTLVVFALAMLAMALPVSAKDKTVTIVDDDGQTYICTYIDGERLQVVNQDTGEEVLDFDFEELEDTIEDAMEDVAEALEELEDLDLDFHIGEESFLRFEHGDERVFLDIDGIMAGVMEVVGNLGEIDIDLSDIHIDSDDDHEHVRHRIRKELRHLKHDVDGDLRSELEELRDEVMELKKELREAERKSRH
jgi:hypothetical protein